MSKAPEAAERETLRTCTTRALDALDALKLAMATFRQLPAPRDTTEKDMQDEISKRLKEVYGEIMAVVFVTSTVVDSMTPQVPRFH
jgi:hypothetical protein